jgi:anaerobic selenocysteine-containing dehydrogenase
MTTRRTFLKASAAAVAVPAVAPAVARPDTLTVALVGCGGRVTSC